MMPGECKRRDEVASMVRMGHWPAGCTEELRAHIAGCGRCSEWILLTQSFQSVRSESMSQAPEGSAFLLWWKAELRRRDAALKSVGRPAVIGPGLALVVSLVAALGFLAAGRAQLQTWFAAGGGPDLFAALKDIPSLFGSMWTGGSLLLAAGLAAVALLGGVVYFASDK